MTKLNLSTRPSFLSPHFTLYSDRPLSTAYGKTKLTLKRTIAGKADVQNDLVEVYAIMNGRPFIETTPE